MADKVCEALLARRPILGQVGQDFAEHRLAFRIIRGVITGCVVERDRVPVEPGHLMVQPIPPLLLQHLAIRREAGDLIAQKAGKLWRGPEARCDRIHRGKGGFVRRFGHPGATVTVTEELMTHAVAWHQCWNGLPDRGERIFQVVHCCLLHRSYRELERVGVQPNV